MVSRRPVRRIEPLPGVTVDPDRWPDAIPAVRRLLTAGMDLPAGVTFLVGANGAGKSTVVEGIADALGAHVEGGSSDHVGGVDRGTRSDRSDLGDRLRVVRGAGGSRRVFFLRAETMHRFYDYLEETGAGAPRARGYGLHQRSHGEGFLDLLAGHHVRTAGVILLDEPESALSFENCLRFAAALADLAAGGRQVLCATHSPLLTALPGATVRQVDEAGITDVEWEDLAVVKDWRFFLDAPQRYRKRLAGRDV